MKQIWTLLLGLAMVSLTQVQLSGQIGGWNPTLQEDARATIEEMISINPRLQVYFDQAYGYAIFPKVTKGGMGIGGAIGQGVVYYDHRPVSVSRLRQVSVGFQFGGQQYSEVIFFQNEKSFSRFMNEELKFDAQASAVALTTSASINLAYSSGVAVFTMANKGLMYEATIGGQHFQNEPISE
jgi:lipid-binding SYLF domain-containing protein